MFGKFFIYQRLSHRGIRCPQRTRRAKRLQVEALERRELLSASPFDTTADRLSLAIAPAAAGTPAMVAPELPAACQSPAALVGDALTRPVSRAAAARASAAAPFGATVGDNAEYMVGDVWVTVVLLESNGKKDKQTENWTSSEIAAVKQEIQEGLSWWQDTFRSSQVVAPRDHLTFSVDFKYADRPVATSYEPINRPQSDQGLWIDDFLNAVKYQTSASYFDDLDRWNDAQRQNHNTDWAYTIFVADSSNDIDGIFADGSHSAYAYLGGPFLVLTYDNQNWGIDRMGEVLAHETGHIFYALDEYPGSGHTYLNRSGYYNTQNLNASDLNPNLAGRVDSIMAEAERLHPAYARHTSSPTSLEMIGWKDSDRDGIVDVLDVPLTLSGSGAYNAATGRYEFSGSSSVGVLGNQNPAGSLRHAISINRVDLIQHRLDGGSWIDGNAYGSATVAVNQSVSVGLGQHTIDFRTVSRENGIMSPVWSRTFDAVGPGVIINQTDGSTKVVEAGTEDTYTLVLATRPTAKVVISAKPNGQVQVTPTKLTFKKDNWNKPQTVTVSAINDSLQEGPHTAEISHTLSSSDSKYKNIKIPAVDVSIADDDLVVPSLSIADARINEGDSGQKALNFTVTLSKASSVPCSVYMQTANGTAVAGQDYVAVPPLTGVWFNPGETSRQVTVNLIGDTLAEADETFYVRLSTPANCELADAEAIGTLINDDTPLISIADARINEGDSGQKALNFTVTLSKASSLPCSVYMQTANGAAVAGQDYVAVPPLTGLWFNPGETTKQVTVYVLGDTMRETDETFYVRLNTTANCAIAVGEAVGTIVNDDTVPPEISIAGAQSAEGDSGQKALNFTVTLSKASSMPCSVYIQTANGTAVAGQDYVAVPPLTGLWFNPGETTKQVTVYVLGDTMRETDETFYVRLNTPANCAIAVGEAVGTIVNDDIRVTTSWSFPAGGAV